MNVIVKRPSELNYAEVDAWRAFQNADPALHSPYFNVEFAWACDQVRRDTRVAVISQKGDIKGFLPFQKGPLGYALPLGGPLSDFQGLIAEAGLSFNLKEVLRAAGIGIYHFEFIPTSQHSFADTFDAEENCHTADLSKGYEHWYEDRLTDNKKSFKKYEGNARRLEKNHGTVSFEANDRDPQCFTTMLEWKSAQYHETGVFDVFSVPWTVKLLQTIGGMQNEYFTGQLSTLRVGGQLAAAHFGMKNHLAAHYWFPVYNPDFARFGVGHTLLFKLLQDHAKDKIKKVHLGIGDYRYKLQFGGTIEPVCRGTATAPSFLSTCQHGAQLVQRGFEALPLGPVSQMPGRAFRRLDRTLAFHLA